MALYYSAWCVCVEGIMALYYSAWCVCRGDNGTVLYRLERIMYVACSL